MNIKNVAAMVGILLVVSALLLVLRVPMPSAARFGLAAVFLFTALGHFLKTDEMEAMVPPSFPFRRLAIWGSGGLEVLFAAGLVVPASAKVTGIAIVAFLVAVTPLNVRAALLRVPFGGHGSGARYLWVRLPLQVLLGLWAYFFAIR